MTEYLFSTCAMDDNNNDILFYSNHDGIPARFNLKKNMICFLPSDISNIVGRGDIVYLMTASRGIIYALLRDGKHVLIHDTKRKKSNLVEIDCNDKQNRSCIDMFVYDSKVFIFCRYRNQVLVSDYLGERWKRVAYDQASIGKYYSGCKVDDEMWLFPLTGSLIGCFDLISYEYKQYSTEVIFNNILHCSNYNNSIYLLDTTGKVYCWDTITHKVELTFRYNLNEEMGRIVATQKKIIILPSFGNNILEYDRYDDILNIYNDYPSDFQYIENVKWSKYHDKCEDEHKIYYAMKLANYLLSIDKISGEIQWLKPVFPTNEQRYEYIMEQDIDIVEERVIPLDIWVRYLNRNNSKKINRESVGEKIWNLEKG